MRSGRVAGGGDTGGGGEDRGDCEGDGTPGDTLILMDIALQVCLCVCFLMNEKGKKLLLY